MTKFIISSCIAALASAMLLAAGSASVQAETTVRDHRKRPIVRDHRKPTFCFGAITGTNCYRF